MKTEEVSESMNALLVYAVEIVDGELLHTDWDTLIQRYYLLTVKEYAAFIIKQQYFLEAEEGYG